MQPPQTQNRGNQFSARAAAAMAKIASEALQEAITGTADGVTVGRESHG